MPSGGNKDAIKKEHTYISKSKNLRYSIKRLAQARGRDSTAGEKYPSPEGDQSNAQLTCKDNLEPE